MKEFVISFSDTGDQPSSVTLFFNDPRIQLNLRAREALIVGDGILIHDNDYDKIRSATILAIIDPSADQGNVVDQINQTSTTTTEGEYSSRLNDVSYEPMGSPDSSVICLDDDPEYQHLSPDEPVTSSTDEPVTSSADRNFDFLEDAPMETTEEPVQQAVSEPNQGTVFFYDDLDEDYSHAGEMDTTMGVDQEEDDQDQDQEEASETGSSRISPAPGADTTSYHVPTTVKPTTISEVLELSSVESEPPADLESPTEMAVVDPDEHEASETQSSSPAPVSPVPEQPVVLNSSRGVIKLTTTDTDPSISFQPETSSTSSSTTSSKKTPTPPCSRVQPYQKFSISKLLKGKVEKQKKAKPKGKNPRQQTSFRGPLYVLTQDGLQKPIDELTFDEFHAYFEVAHKNFIMQPPNVKVKLNMEFFKEQMMGSMLSCLMDYNAVSFMRLISFALFDDEVLKVAFMPQLHMYNNVIIRDPKKRLLTNEAVQAFIYLMEFFTSHIIRGNESKLFYKTARNCFNEAVSQHRLTGALRFNSPFFRRYRPPFNTSNAFFY